MPNPKGPPKMVELPKSVESSPLPPPPPPIVSLPQPNLNSLGIDLVSSKKSSQGQSTTSSSSGDRSHHHHHQGLLSKHGSTPCALPQQPSVYEMAALTQDLDTQLITTKIKEALLANNIGQKVCAFYSTL